MNLTIPQHAGEHIEFDSEIAKDVRHKLDVLEQSMQEGIVTADLEEWDDEPFLEHYFIPGVYAREMTLPAGVAIVGKLHKHPRIVMVSAGECSFVSEFGSARVNAPYTAVIPAGSKTAIFAHTETVWTSIHRTDETDLVKIEDELIATNHSELEEF